jgi:hypothetical protein
VVIQGRILSVVMVRKDLSLDTTEVTMRLEAHIGGLLNYGTHQISEASHPNLRIWSAGASFRTCVLRALSALEATARKAGTSLDEALALPFLVDHEKRLVADYTEEAIRWVEEDLSRVVVHVSPELHRYATVDLAGRPAFLRLAQRSEASHKLGACSHLGLAMDQWGDGHHVSGSGDGSVTRRALGLGLLLVGKKGLAARTAKGKSRGLPPHNGPEPGLAPGQPVAVAPVNPTGLPVTTGEAVALPFGFQAFRAVVARKIAVGDMDQDHLEGLGLDLPTFLEDWRPTEADWQAMWESMADWPEYVALRKADPGLPGRAAGGTLGQNAGLPLTVAHPEDSDSLDGWEDVAMYED